MKAVEDRRHELQRRMRIRVPQCTELSDTDRLRKAVRLYVCRGAKRATGDQGGALVSEHHSPPTAPNHQHGFWFRSETKRGLRA